MTYVPGKHTIMTANGVEEGVIEGEDFAALPRDTGRYPVQEDPKKAASGRLKLAVDSTCGGDRLA